MQGLRLRPARMSPPTRLTAGRRSGGSVRLRGCVIQLRRHGLGAAPSATSSTRSTTSRRSATVDAAWDAGVRYFDTAPHYGLGLSERRLGAALRDRPRAAYTLSTKVGRLLVDPSWRGGRRPTRASPCPPPTAASGTSARDGVRRSPGGAWSASASTGSTSCYSTTPTTTPTQAIAEAYPALAELRDEGVVGAIGAGHEPVGRCSPRFVRETDVDVVLLAGRYTLLDQPAPATLLPACAERGRRVLTAGVFNCGLLADRRARRGLPSTTRPRPADLVERARRDRRVCERHGIDLPPAALAFPLRHPAVAAVVVGARTPEEVRTNADLRQRPVPDALWHDLRAEGLLHKA